MQQRHLLDEASCPWGYGQLETAAHALFQCPRLDVLWLDNGCSVMREGDLNVPMCDLVEKWKQIDPKVKIKGAFLMWCVWGIEIT